MKKYTLRWNAATRFASYQNQLPLHLRTEAKSAASHKMAGQFVLRIVAAHETFSDFLRLYRRGEDKLNVAENDNDDNSFKTTAPRGRSAKPFAGTDR
jgi:hypothetical protein